MEVLKLSVRFFGIISPPNNFRIMHSLVNSNFNRTYNPTGRNTALTDIKRLLTSRDIQAQNKACGYLIEVINRFNKSSKEVVRLIEYLLENDITVFLCEATANLDFSLFRSILVCLRLLWRERQFFAEEHAAHAMTAVLRALAHYASGGSFAAVEACLHFLTDLLNGISTFKTTPPLSYQSAYSTVQLLSCLNALAPRINTKPGLILSSALVLHSLVSYQPDELTLKGGMATALVEVVSQWLFVIIGALNHSMLVGNKEGGMFLVIICHLGIDVLRLIKLLQHGNQKVNFVQTILTDNQEIEVLKQSAFEMQKSVQRIIIELVVFVKENQTQISTEEYLVFLKFLLNFLYENGKTEVLQDFCDVLFSKGYLTMLPQVQIMRNDNIVRKISTLVLGEILKTLSEKYLHVNDSEKSEDTFSTDIHMGLIELQYGIEKPQYIGTHLQKNRPYSLLIYIYFYCQSSENPEDATAPLLPFIIEHILTLPKSMVPPPYIIKALWLVFAMATISNGSLDSLDERVYLEKATDRLVSMLHTDPSAYYTHNPAILLWAFTSQRIPTHVRIQVLSQWLKKEDTLPEELTSEPIVWELLLQILVQCSHSEVVAHCMEALLQCLGELSDQQQLAGCIWSRLPAALARALADYHSGVDRNICYLLDVASSVIPSDIDPAIGLKIAVLLTTLFTKNNPDPSLTDEESKHHFEYVCLKLSLYLLCLANTQNDNRVLLTYTNRPGFLTSVLAASVSVEPRVACAALQLLSYVIHYFSKNSYQPNSVIEIQTHLIIKSLRRDCTSDRNASLLQLIYMVLNSGRNTPLTLSCEVNARPDVTQQCNALRALMFRMQLMLCCRESNNQSQAGWKTLSALFKHAIMTKKDDKLITALTSQPWTHILIQFQLSQNINEEFLRFSHNWLSLLRVTLQNNREKNSTLLSKYSLIVKTMMLLKKYLNDEDDSYKDLKQNILEVVADLFKFTSVIVE